MDYTPRHDTERIDNEILFSRTVKAGKRIYYIDVKRDRKGVFYISMTESKRLKDNGGDASHPTFEKHKIFLYREDLEKFQHAFNEVAQFTQDNAPVNEYTPDWSGPALHHDASPDADGEAAAASPYDIKIDF